MKCARVIPLYKKGDRNVFTNYRPVSILPQFSKILEKLYNDRLMSFVNKHNVLYDGQYRFRKQLSTTMALMELVEEITTATDNSELTVGVFVDLKKAFDTINHGILIKK
jgi:hypothetical protein